MRPFLCLVLIVLYQFLPAQSSDSPNFIFVFCDDLNISGLGLYDDTQAITPYLDSLSSESFVFTNAHANAPICGPSRASIFTGVLPSTSGHFGYSMSANSWKENPVLAQTTTMFEHFKNNGYRVFAAGKIFHKNRNRISDFDDLNLRPFQGPYPYANRTHSSLPESFTGAGISFSPLEDTPSYPESEGWFTKGQPFIYQTDGRKSLLGDEISVLYLDSLLEQYSDKGLPLFITLGMYSPHAPFHVPRKYFDLYPTDSIDLSQFEGDPMNPAIAAFKNRFNASSNEQLDLLISESTEGDSLLYLKQFIQGYYASVSFLDDQIGSILESMESHGYSDNTYLIISSDHGYHLGSRRIIKKTTLWNDATKVPLMIKGPGIESNVSSKAISLVDIYPILVDLANIPEPDHELDGSSFQAMFTSGSNTNAFISAASKEKLDLDSPGDPCHQHHAILSNNFKYILYSSGEDELYDIGEDQNELNDLTRQSNYQPVRAALHNSLSEKIEGLRLPTQNYRKLFYGDFEQNLNGWIPSQQNNVIGIADSADNWDSKHVLLQTSGVSIINENIKIDSTGFYELKFLAFADSGTAQLEIIFGVELEETTSIIVNELIDIDTVPRINTLLINLTQNLGDYTLRLKTIEGLNVHIDNVEIIELTEYDLAIEDCTEASEISMNSSFTDLVFDTLVYAPNQAKFKISQSSTLSRQKWYQFTPSQQTGLIGCFTAGTGDPLIEIWKDCDDSFTIASSNEQAENLEYLIMDSLELGETYYVRVSDTQVNEANYTFAKSLFQEIEKAEIINVTEGTFILNDIVYPNFEVDSLTFRFSALEDPSQSFAVVKEYNPSNTYDLTEINLDSILYSVSVSYDLIPTKIKIPFGPSRLLNADSITSINLQNTFNVFPNPLPEGRSQVIISKEDTESEGPVSIELMDLTGEILKTWNNYDLKIQAELALPPDISNGMYFLIITDKNGISYTQKLFK